MRYTGRFGRTFLENLFLSICLQLGALAVVVVITGIGFLPSRAKIQILATLPFPVSA